MRTLFVATLFALGLGVMVSSNTSAAPINYTPLPTASEDTNLVQKIWWDRYGQWCSRRCIFDRVTGARKCWIACSRNRIR